MSRPTKRAALRSTGVFGDARPKSEEPREMAAASRLRVDREGRAALPFWATRAAKKQLRIMAAELDTTQQELMTEALNLMFAKYGKPPIA